MGQTLNNPDQGTGYQLQPGETPSIGYFERPIDKIGGIPDKTGDVTDQTLNAHRLVEPKVTEEPTEP